MVLVPKSLDTVCFFLISLFYSNHQKIQEVQNWCTRTGACDSYTRFKKSISLANFKPGFKAIASAMPEFDRTNPLSVSRITWYSLNNRFNHHLSSCIRHMIPFPTLQFLSDSILDKIEYMLFWYPNESRKAGVFWVTLNCLNFHPSLEQDFLSSWAFHLNEISDLYKLISCP